MHEEAMTSAITPSTDSKCLPFSYPLEMTTSYYPAEEAIGLTYPYIPKHCNRVRRSHIFSDDEDDETDCSLWEPGYSPKYASLSSVLKRVQRQRQESLNSETSDLSDVIPSKQPKKNQCIQIILNLIPKWSAKVLNSENLDRPPLLTKENKDYDDIPGIKNKPKIWPSFPKWLLPKRPQRSWWCKSCIRPRDRCVCICNLL